MRRVWKASLLACSGCAMHRSSLHAASPDAHELSKIGWPVLIAFLLICAAVWGIILWIGVRRPGTFDEHAALSPGAFGGGGQRWVTIGGFVLPTIAFSIIFVVTLRAMDAFPHMHHPGMKADIRVIGHQWWWEVQYLGEGISERVTTANEIHVPVGHGIEIELQTADVIHSFWVPRLFGKVDLVPGMTNHVHVEASQPGLYDGECAEYCGLQHAKMRFAIIAEPEPAYQAFVTHLREEATTPETPEAQRGFQLFMTGPCMTCHTVRGTAARGTVGPDLTHLGVRHTIAAGYYPKDLATLHAWVMNAPSLKPGTRMPAMTRYDGAQLADLVAYLESLR